MPLKGTTQNLWFKPKNGSKDWRPLEVYKMGDVVPFHIDGSEGDIPKQPISCTFKCKSDIPGWLLFYRLTGQYGCRRNMKKVKAYLRREQITRRRTMRKQMTIKNLEINEKHNL